MSLALPERPRAPAGAPGPLGAAAPVAALDFRAALAEAGWRERFAWPIGFEPFWELGSERMRLLVALTTAEPDGEARDALLLMGGMINNFIGHIVEAAKTIEAGRAAGFAFRTLDPELRYLLEGTGAEALPDVTPSPKLARTRHAWFRRIARTASWTAPLRLPGALILPEAVAVTHNVLLLDDARRSATRLRFHHAEAYLDRIRLLGGDGDVTAAAEALADRLADALLCDIVLPDDLMRRARRLILRRATAAFAFGIADLRRVRRMRRVPRALWCGTLGHYGARLLASEVRRRGGHVTNFDHAGSRGLHVFVHANAFSEFALSDRFGTLTPAMAARIEASGFRRHLKDPSRPLITGGRGDPQIRSVATLSPKRAANPLRVVYLPVIMRGARQSIPPAPADTLYLEWSLWLAAELVKLPISFLCRPHPEGELKGERHPLAAVAPLAAKNFEALIRETDLFVFDYYASTTLHEALCTEARILMLDTGARYFQPDMVAEFARRCRVLRVGPDARNRLRVEPEALKDAVLTPFPPVEPGPWRHYHLA